MDCAKFQKQNVEGFIKWLKNMGIVQNTKYSYEEFSFPKPPFFTIPKFNILNTRFLPNQCTQLVYKIKVYFTQKENLFTTWR